MALYMKIPKDMSEIKDKLAFNLTKRQLICFSIGLAVGFTTYWLTYKALDTTMAAVLLFFVASPFFIMGKYEKHGFHLEDIIKNLIRYNLCSKVRPYHTENIYRQMIEDIEYNEEVEMLETGRKKVKVHKNQNSTAHKRRNEAH